VQQLGLPIAMPELRPVSTAEYAAEAPRPANSRLSTELLRRVSRVAVPDWRLELAELLPEIFAQYRRGQAP
jgi:dTDP-4-dehydrorhamnose reductase